MTKFSSALAEFGALDPLLGSITLATALSRLSDVLRETPFEAQTESASVTVIDANTVAGMQFDALWVAGLDATRTPPPTQPDPLIPLQLQREAGIPESLPESTLQQARRQLDRLTLSARIVVLSWPQRDGDAALQPSPLLARWPSSQDMSGPGHSQSLTQLVFSARPQLEAIEDIRAPRVKQGAASGGAMIVELQSRCAFRAQAELRLRAGHLQQVRLGIEPRERGTLLHRVLQAVWSELRDQASLLARDSAQLQAQVLGHAQAQAAQVLRPAGRQRARLAALEVENVVHQVMTLLDIERKRSGFRVRMAEQTEYFEIGGLKIRLQADRIDELASGGNLLIDYKLGDSHQPGQWLDTVPGRPRRPQLPLYALAHEKDARALAFVTLAPGVVEFRGWSAQSDVAPGIVEYPPRRIRPDQPAHWDELLARWGIVLPQLAADFVSGDARVEPLKQECETCHLSTLCRIHERTLLVLDDDASGNDDE